MVRPWHRPFCCASAALLAQDCAFTRGLSTRCLVALCITVVLFFGNLREPNVEHEPNDEHVSPSH